MWGMEPRIFTNFNHFSKSHYLNLSILRKWLSYNKATVRGQDHMGIRGGIHNSLHGVILYHNHKDLSTSLQELMKILYNMTIKQLIFISSLE